MKPEANIIPECSNSSQPSSFWGSEGSSAQFIQHTAVLGDSRTLQRYFALAYLGFYMVSMVNTHFMHLSAVCRGSIDANLLQTQWNDITRMF